VATTVRLERQGPVAALVLESEDGENRISTECLGELRACCDALAGDDAVRVVTVSGMGSTFSLGWSEEFLSAATRAGEAPVDPFSCLVSLPQPVVAGITGPALSAGLELALTCDIRIAAENSRLGLPEVEHGLIPLAGGTQRLPRLVGRGRAAAMILLGLQVDAGTAFDWGLVNEVCPAAELPARVQRIAGVLASRGPIAERFAKEAVREGADLPLARALRYELDLSVLLQTTEDRAEGVRAFVEKRPPRFLGR
jgi:enoyl-CoA hydratase